MEDILIHGTGTMGKLLFSEFSENNDYNVKAFVCDDKFYTSDSFMGKFVCKSSEVLKYFSPQSIPIISTGVYHSLRERYNSYLKMKEKGFHFINFISKKANVTEDIDIGENNIIFAGVYLDYYGKIGNCNLIRPNTYIGHNFNIGNGISISPGCNIAGYTTIEDLSFIGIGSTILGKLTIGKECLIGAASLVTKDTEPFSTYVGSPARKIKTHEDTGVLL